MAPGCLLQSWNMAQALSDSGSIELPKEFPRPFPDMVLWAPLSPGAQGQASGLQASLASASAGLASAFGWLVGFRLGSGLGFQLGFRLRLGFGLILV